MKTDDSEVFTFMRRCMVARIATLSRSGRPSITPLYFTCPHGRIWLGTADWTLAARQVKADPRVNVLFEAERHPRDRRLLRITGSATVRTDLKTVRAYELRVAFKYMLSPGGIRNNLTHLRLIPLMNRYHAQSAKKGPACVIDVTPEHAEFLSDSPPD